MKLILWCLTACLAANDPARAELPALSQEFENYMLAHHYVAVGLESGGTNQQWIRAKVNGEPVVLMVDTGTTRTMLTHQFASNLGLDIHETDEIYTGDTGKDLGHIGMALIKSFKLSCGDINRTNTIEVLPKKADLGWGIDGILGLDYLALNAAIYPVGGHGLLMKPCPAAAIGIGDYMTKLGFAAVPISCGSEIWVDGHINGAAMKFMLDTGAFVSDFRLQSVREAVREDLNPTILPLGGMDDKYLTSFEFKPRSMDIGGFDVSHQRFLATNSYTFNHYHYDGLVGVDLLGNHQAVIDLGGQTLWMR
jgi:predicted aspartyl protease